MIFMKRIFLGATAFAALLFSSCGKNDNASTDLTGAWQLESATVAGQSQILGDCDKKTVYVFTQNQLTFHEFETNRSTRNCNYDNHVETYKIEGNLIKDANDPNGKGILFSISGNTLTLTIEENGQKETLNLKKINQAQLDAILATINNGGGNNN
ncbi:lipocalin-like protein [Capnocytophaga sp. CM59]|nr:lipocalin-like protein [Capnocytophaga sp. CM59]